MSGLIKQLDFSWKFALLRKLRLEEIITSLINCPLNHEVVKFIGKLKSIYTPRL